jgi:stage II sporulation protein AA (anti-sigma F factor antagonist)
MAEQAYHHIRCRPEQGALVIAVAERQVQGDELADALRREFFQALEQYPSQGVVLDFHEVEFLASAGFRPLLSLYRKLRDQGGRLLFCNLSPQVLDVLRVTRLLSTSGAHPAPFESADTLEEAVNRARTTETT